MRYIIYEKPRNRFKVCNLGLSECYQFRNVTNVKSHLQSIVSKGDIKIEKHFKIVFFFFFEDLYL